MPHPERSPTRRSQAAPNAASIEETGRVALSVIVPVYNSGRELERCLDALAASDCDELARQHEFKPVIVFLLEWDDAPEDRRRQEWLRRYAGRTNTPFQNLTAGIRTPEMKSFFIPHNPHWNARGLRAVVGRIRRFLADEVLSN